LTLIVIGIVSGLHGLVAVIGGATNRLATASRVSPVFQARSSGTVAQTTARERL
jgi:hypothetical protein